MHTHMWSCMHMANASVSWCFICKCRANEPLPTVLFQITLKGSSWLMHVCDALGREARSSNFDTVSLFDACDVRDRYCSLHDWLLTCVIWLTSCSRGTRSCVHVNHAIDWEIDSTCCMCDYPVTTSCLEPSSQNVVCNGHVIVLAVFERGIEHSFAFLCRDQL